MRNTIWLSKFLFLWGLALVLVAVPDTAHADTTPPAVVTGFTGYPGDGRVSLKWSENTDYDLAGYRLYRSTDGGATWSAPTSLANPATKTMVMGLTPYTPYTFGIAAYDSTGNESARQTVQVTPTDFTVSFAGYTAGTIVGYWDDTLDGDTNTRIVWRDGFNYHVEYRLSKVFRLYQIRIYGSYIADVALVDPNGKILDTPNKTKTTAGGWTTWSFGADSSGGYDYVARIRIFSNASYATIHEVQVVKSTATQDTTPPAVVTGFTGYPGDGAVSLQWNANTDYDLAGYRLYQSTDGGATWGVPASLDKTATKTTVTGLTPYTPYTFGITTYDSTGNESDKQTTQVTPADFDVAFVRISAGTVAGSWADTLDGDIGTQVSWQRFGYTYQYAEYGLSKMLRLYQVMIYGSGINDVVLVDPNGREKRPLDKTKTTSGGWTIWRFGVDESGGYDYVSQIRLSSDTNYASISEVQVVKSTGTQDTTPPAVVTGLTGYPGDGTVFLKWTANTDYDLAGYRLYQSADGGTTWGTPASLDKTSTTTTVTGLTPYTPYTFGITTYDGTGNESSRQTVQVAPTGFAVSFEEISAGTASGNWADTLDGDTGTGVTWTWQGGIAEYRLSSPVSVYAVKVYTGNSIAINVRLLDANGMVLNPSSSPKATISNGWRSWTHGTDPGRGYDNVARIQLVPSSGTYLQLRDLQVIEIERPVPVDSTPPVTALILPPTESGWYNEPVLLGLETTDPAGGLGTDRTEYSQEGCAGWQRFPASGLTLNTDGIHTIFYRGVDLAGNAEECRQVMIRIDTLPPQVAPSFDQATDRLALQVADGLPDVTSGVESVQCSLDVGTSWFDCATPYQFEQRGEYQVQYRARDRAGNLTEGVEAVTVLHTPVLELRLPPAQYSDKAQVSVKLMDGAEPIANAVLMIELNGGTLGPVTTDAGGGAALASVINLPDGVHPVTVTYSGEPGRYLDSASQSGTLTVVAEEAAVAFTSDGLDLSATITQAADGFPGDLSLTRVIFRISRVNVDNSLTELPDLTAPVGPDGVATIPAGLPEGYYLVTTELVGNGYFAAAPVTAAMAVSTGKKMAEGLVRWGEPGATDQVQLAVHRTDTSGSVKGTLSVRTGIFDLRVSKFNWLLVTADYVQVLGQSGSHVIQVGLVPGQGNGKNAIPGRLTLTVWESGQIIYQVIDQQVDGNVNLSP